MGICEQRNDKLPYLCAAKMLESYLGVTRHNIVCHCVQNHMSAGVISLTSLSMLVMNIEKMHPIKYVSHNETVK